MICGFLVTNNSCLYQSLRHSPVLGIRAEHHTTAYGLLINQSLKGEKRGIVLCVNIADASIDYLGKDLFLVGALVCLNEGCPTQEVNVGDLSLRASWRKLVILVHRV